MLNRISIKNFKGIKEGEVGNLGRINLLIGKNNSGKSTILESLLFLRASIKPGDDLGRTVLDQLFNRRVRRQVLDLREFFYNYDWDAPISIDTSSDDVDIHVVIIHSHGHLRYDFRNPKNNAQLLYSENRLNNNSVDIGIEGFGSGSYPDALTPFSALEKDAARVRFRQKKNISAKTMGAYLSFLGNCTIIDAESIRNLDSVEQTFWGRILEKRDDKRIANIINEAYGLGIEHLTMGSYSQNRYKLFAALPKISIHIDDYGEGFRYALAILMIASQLSDTILLLEEPEVHQHLGVIKPLFKALLQLSKENNLQLFISTHSQDIVKVLTELSEDDLKIFHMDLEDGILTNREISKIDTKLMMDLGIDIRLIDSPFTFFILEGKEDKIFFNEVAIKLSGKDLESLGYITVIMSKDGQKNVTCALASTGKDILIQRDYDSEKENQILQSFTATLKGLGDCRLTNKTVNVSSTGSKVQILPTGLPDDAELGEIGITRHSTEDYLLKLLCVDKNVKEWAKIDLRTLRKRADSLKGCMKLNSSKPLFQLLGSLKNGLSVEELIKTMVEKAEKDNITSVLGSMSKIFRVDAKTK